MPTERRPGVRDFQRMNARELCANLNRLGVIDSSATPRDDHESAAAFLARLVRAGQVTAFQSQLIQQGKLEYLLVGSYLILDRIGSGGMGQVFKARHRSMNRLVALKLLQTRLLRDEHAVQRFYREVEAAARLHHPHIVTAYDAGCSNRQHFLAMEYVDGVDIATLVRGSGPLSCETALGYLSQSLEGLAYAHANGIIHRDLKPANLLLSSNGTVKILDMGLARIERDEGVSEQQLTGDSTLLGTIDFMSPEQGYDPSSAGVSSDIYSLGCSLYWMVTGAAPFARGSIPATLLAHQRDPIPSVRAVLPQVAPGIDEILVRALAKDPGDRFQSANEFRLAIEHVLEQTQGQFAGQSGLQPPPQPDNHSMATVTGRRDRTKIGSVKIHRQQGTRKTAPWWLPWLIAAACLVVAIVVGVRSRLAESKTPGNDDPEQTMGQVATEDPPARDPDDSISSTDVTAIDQRPQLVDQLLNVSADEVPSVCQAIASASSPSELQRSLLRLVEDATVSESARLRCFLALMMLGDSRLKTELTQRLMSAPDAEFELIVKTLQPPPTELVETLWIRVTDEDLLAVPRLRIYEALACWSPENTRWDEHEAVFAEELALTGRSLPDDCAAFGDARLMSYWKRWATGPEETPLAISALRIVIEHHAADIERMMSALQHAGTGRRVLLVPVFQAALDDERERGPILQRLRSACTNGDPAGRINAFAMLWATAGGDECLEILTDPQREQRDPYHEQLVHAFLVNHAGSFPTPSLLQLCENLEESSGAEMELLLKAIGVRQFYEKSETSLSSRQTQTVQNAAETLFVEAIDARGHATATWYLQQAGLHSKISELRGQLRGQHARLSKGQIRSRGWYVAECGLTMVVLADLNLAVSMTEIPASLFVYQQQTPTPEASGRQTVSLIGGPPQVNVDWVDAVEFAMWLNESTKYRNEELAFSSRVIIQAARKKFEDHVSEVIEDPKEKASVIALGNGRPSRNAEALTNLFSSIRARGQSNRIPYLTVRQPVSKNLGYRLPTVDEWRSIAAAGLTLSGTEGLREWSLENANGSAQPIGTRFSDRNGLFDLQGNVAEWCCDATQSKVLFSSSQPVAGCSFLESATLHKSSLIRSYAVLERAPQIGFRVVQTLE